jgi:chromosome segregation ATPase
VGRCDEGLARRSLTSELEPAVRETRTELQEWKAAADQVNENVPQVIEGLNRIEQGEDVDYNQLSQRFAAAMEGMDRLETKSKDVSETLAATARLSADGSAEVEGVPVVGGELATLLRQTSTSLESTASETRSFGNTLGQQQSQLAEVQATAEAEERAMMSAWGTCQSAEMKVYGTLGSSGAMLIGAVAMLGRRFV